MALRLLYSAGRAHRGLDLRAPNDEPNVIPMPATVVRRRRALGGLLNEYHAIPTRPPVDSTERSSSAA